MRLIGLLQFLMIAIDGALVEAVSLVTTQTDFLRRDGGPGHGNLMEDEKI